MPLILISTLQNGLCQLMFSNLGSNANRQYAHTEGNLPIHLLIKAET